MATWPTLLPNPQFDGYEITQIDSVIRSQGDGPSRARQRYGLETSRITLSWIFTAEQLELFDAWHKHEAYDGGAWFTISIAAGLGTQVVDARFAVPPKKTLISPAWHVSAELEIRNIPVT